MGNTLRLLLEMLLLLLLLLTHSLQPLFLLMDPQPSEWTLLRLLKNDLKRH